MVHIRCWREYDGQTRWDVVPDGAMRKIGYIGFSNDCRGSDSDRNAPAITHNCVSEPHHPLWRLALTFSSANNNISTRLSDQTRKTARPWFPCLPWCWTLHTYLSSSTRNSRYFKHRSHFPEGTEEKRTGGILTLADLPFLQISWEVWERPTERELSCTKVSSWSRALAMRW